MRNISKHDIRRMIACAAWDDKQSAHIVAWSDRSLQRVRGYIDCLDDLGAITSVEACKYGWLIDHLILKINKVL